MNIKFQCWDFLVFGNYTFCLICPIDIKAEVYRKLQRIVHIILVKRDSFQKGVSFPSLTLKKKKKKKAYKLHHPSLWENRILKIFILLAGEMKGAGFLSSCSNYYISVCSSYCTLCAMFSLQTQFCSTDTSHI